MASDPEVGFYEFSLADAVITELARLRSLVVRPSSLISKYQGITEDPREIGRELFMSVIPTKRAVAAEEIAAAAVFLASDNARSINGDTIAIDGGSLTRGYPALLTGLKDRHA